MKHWQWCTVQILFCLLSGVIYGLKVWQSGYRFSTHSELQREWHKLLLQHCWKSSSFCMYRMLSMTWLCFMNINTFNLPQNTMRQKQLTLLVYPTEFSLLLLEKSHKRFSSLSYTWGLFLCCSQYEQLDMKVELANNLLPFFLHCRMTTNNLFYLWNANICLGGGSS